MSKRILVCDDAAETRTLLADVLQAAGYAVTAVATWRDMMVALEAVPPHLVLLDVNLPDGNGLELARRHHLGSRAPLIFVTGCDGREDIVAGLDSGDDYVTKPLEPEILLARVRSVLRRVQPAGQRIIFHGWTLDVMRRELFCPDGSTLPLTHGEFNILAALALARPDAVAREVLLDAVSARQGTASLHVVDTLVSRLRRKMRWQGQDAPILTVRGVGYCLDGGA